MSDTTKHRGQQSSRRLYGPDLLFYFSTEDLRILLRKPTREGGPHVDQAARPDGHPRRANYLRPQARAGAGLSGARAWGESSTIRTHWRLGLHCSGRGLADSALVVRP